MNKRIALVTSVPSSGGVWTVTRFLYELLHRNGDYDVELVLVATSAFDEASVRLLSPRTWRRGVQIIEREIEGYSCRHVGAFLTEFEFQRYRPRRALTELLNQFDLIQVVAGTPAWATVTQDVRPPVCLFIATTIRQERTTLIQKSIGWRKVWTPVMTFLNARIEKQALQSVACTFVESDYTRRLVDSWVPPDRLLLGPPGVDTQFFSPADSGRDDGYILCVGRLGDPRKNIHLLLEAYQQLRRQITNAPRLVLAGRTGLVPKDCVFIVSSGLEDHVDIRTNICAPELRSLYQNAALFVLPSDEEGLGIVLLEAMASGLPVVSTDCGGPATAVIHGETGILVPVRNANALANAICNLLENSQERYRMGRAARRRAVERFSVESTGQIYLETYAELMTSDKLRK